MDYRPNDDEAACAWAVAQRRNSLNGGQTNLPGGETATPRERLLQHYVACLSEIAVSRVTNLYWSGCGKGATGLMDVGDKWQVRSITEPHKGLLVRTKDADDDPIILVYVNIETRQCTILGHETVRAVKERGRCVDAGTPNPCWVLPPGKLKPGPTTTS